MHDSTPMPYVRTGTRLEPAVFSTLQRKLVSAQSAGASAWRQVFCWCVPDSFKGYTIGDNTTKAVGKYPWRMDDEKVADKGYEKFLKASLVNVCVHKGLFPPSVEQQFPHLLAYSDVRDVGKADRRAATCALWIRREGVTLSTGGRR